MIILDDNNNSINEVELFLTLEEAEDFLGRLKGSYEMKPDILDTGNVFGTPDGFRVTPGYMEFCIYTAENMMMFPPEFVNLIKREIENY